MQTVGTGKVVGGRDEREVVANDRRLLAEADYERGDFKRGIRNEAATRCLEMTDQM
jgi:hypothetical protein